MSLHRRTRRAALVLAGGLATGLAAAGCSQGSVNTTADYCAVVREHAVAVSESLPSTPQQAAAVLAGYRAVAAAAPLAIRSEWNVVVALIRAASTLDGTDANAVATFTELARTSKTAADRVVAYTAATCKISLGGDSVVPATTATAATTG